jgi:hypothetical protein
MDLPLANPELRPWCSETTSLCLPVTKSEGRNPSSLLSLTLRKKNARVPLASAPFQSLLPHALSSREVSCGVIPLASDQA